MIGLKADAYQINTNGSGQYEFFSDISTRALLSVRIGESAGKISKGNGNVFAGYESGKQNTNGSYGVFVGFQAGALNQYGNENVFVGAYSGKYNQRGDRNTFVGYQSGERNKDGSDCTAVGVAALRENTTGNKNVAVGTRAGERILDGDNNTMVGMEAGQDIRSGNNNTMTGYRSGRASFRGNENTYFGAFAGYSNSYGDGNAFVGYKAGEYLGYGNFNVAVGAYALQKATYGSCNIAIGAFAGSLATGSGNVFVGTGAGTSNFFGSNSTYVGQDVGYNAQGSDNVYIGTRAAYYIAGNKNVVIGVDAVPEESLSGSVMIGYKVGTATFRTGISNIFIGTGADSHTSDTSFSIAIGSKNTKTFDNSISIGDEIDNSGINSVLIGNEIRSDANQCVTLGKTIDVSSVYVFNDLLNYRFPVSLTEGYNTFGLREDYSSMLYLNGVSNEVAIATVNTSNIYDSGCNLLRGLTQTDNYNNRTIFNYNLLYQGNTIAIDPSYGSLNISISSNLLNTNYLVVDNFNKNALVIDTQGSPNITSADIVQAAREIIINGSLITELTIGSVSSNIIPYTNPNLVFRFLYAIPKRNQLYTIVSNVDYHISTNSLEWLMKPTGSNSYYDITQTIPAMLSNLSVDALDGQCNVAIPDIIHPSIQYQRRWYVYREPSYGYINHPIFTSTDSSSNQVTYTLYPEAIYASNDSFQMSVLNQIQVNSTSDNNVYGILPESTKIKEQNVFFQQTPMMFMSSNIYLHPTTSTYVDRSYLNRIPYIPTSNNLSFLSIDSNICLTYNEQPYYYSNIDTLQIPYDTFIQSPFQLHIIQPSSSVIDPLVVEFEEKTYSFSCTYTCNLTTTSSCNITISISPFTIYTDIPIPFSRAGYSNTYVYTYPTYGTLGIPYALESPYTYNPKTINFGTDMFSLMLQKETPDFIKLNVYVDYNSNFGSVDMYKLQEEVTLSEPSYIFSEDSSNSIFNIPFYTNYTCNIVIVNPPSGSARNDTYHYQLQDTSSYSNERGGYIYASNITIEYTYSIGNRNDFNTDPNPSYFGLTYVPASNEVGYPTSNTGIDFILYTEDTPKASYRIATWNYETNSPGSYTQTDILLTTAKGEMRSNQMSYNRYYYLTNTFTYDTIYKHGCNIDIYHSNVNNYHDTYYDLYHHYIYTNHYTQSNLPIITSNVSYLPNSIEAPTYYVTNRYISTTRSITSNIPTMQLKNIHLYQRDGIYHLGSNTASNLVVLQKNVGPVTTFYQSNIEQEEIHIWNTTPPSLLDSIQQSNVYFTDKTIHINYLKPKGDTYTFYSTGTDVTYINREPTNYLTIPFDNTRENIVIQHCSNVSFAKKVGNTYTPTFQFTYAEIDSGQLYAIANKGYSNTGFVEYIQYNNIRTTPPIKYIIPSTYQTSHPYYLNLGIASENKRTLTSNHLYYQKDLFNYSDILYEITTLDANGSLYKEGIPLTVGNTFSQKDIHEEKIQWKHYTSIGSNYVGYKIKTTSGDLLTGQKLYIQRYLQNAYLSTASQINSSNVILQLKDTYQHLLEGDLWKYLQSNYIFNEELRDVELRIVKPPSKGYLISSNMAYLYDTNTITSIPYGRLASTSERIYYIPYEPMSLSNDSIQGYFTYSNVASSVYTIPIKNYWSRWKELILPVHNEKFYDTLPYTSNIFTYSTRSLPRSVGMIQDNIYWSPETINIQGMSQTLADKTSNVTLTLSYENRQVMTQLSLVPITQRKYILTENVTKQVDNGNYFYLSYLLACISNSTEKGIFYITKNPENGVILKKKTNTHIEAEPYFTIEELQNKQVFYQHYGLTTNESISQTDSFKVKIATNPYDISIQEITTNIQVVSAPVLTINNYDYIYYASNVIGSNQYNQLDTTRLSATKGYISVYSQSNIEVFTSNVTSNIYTSSSIIYQQDIANGLVYYRPTSNLFRTGYNQNENMKLQFTVNSSTETTDPNPLSIYPVYQTRVLQEWYSKYNTYESKNIIISSINSNQSITYTRDVNNTSNISYDNRKCQIRFDFLAYQPPLNNTSKNKEFNEKYLQEVNTYHYTFEIVDASKVKIFDIDVTHSNIRVKKNNQTIIVIDATNVKDASLLKLDNNWKSFELINYDDVNDNNLSIYFNGNNYSKGLGIPSLSFSNLEQLRINVPIYDSLNYYNYQLVKTISPGTNVYYNLENFNTQLRFRNFNIFLATYEQNQVINTSGIYNIVIGNELNIKGLNNICLGRNFVTTGQGSIIVGSDIGVNATSGTNTLNEIFNSVIISNGSFINSKVRDTIAIGNGILNDLTINIEDFLAKKPVLIGNDINQSKIDFHINFQNTFLKTTVGSPQIYCGLEGEHVCIGYNTNEKFTNNYLLHVNGGIEVTGPTRTVTGGLQSVKQLFNNISFVSGTSHTCTFIISWYNVQTSDYTAFSLNCKFKIIRDDTTYAYRRFEVWITPKNDIASNKPNMLSDLEISTFNIGDITNLDHTVTRYGEKSVGVSITWNTTTPLTPSSYISGMLEAEVVGSVDLGEIIIQSPNQSIYIL